MKPQPLRVDYSRRAVAVVAGLLLMAVTSPPPTFAAQPPAQPPVQPPAPTPAAKPAVKSDAEAVAKGSEKDAGFRLLFNGKDLAGWHNVSCAPSTWTVKDGMLICSGKPIGQLRTKRMYQNFILELEWRHMKPKGNAGVMLWADDITARGQPFHRAVEVQVLENAYGKSNWFTTHGDIFPIHGARMRPLTGHNVGKASARAFPTEHRSNPSPQWNHYRIECNDGAVTLAVNGKVVTRGADATPRKGYICLESEGGIVHYRNIRIKELPDTPVKPEQIAIADRGYRCLYLGVDLSGWLEDEAGSGKWHARDWNLYFDGKGKDNKKGGAWDGKRAIRTREAFGDVGFIFDVKRYAETKAAQVHLRGEKGFAITIDPTDPAIAKHLGKVGKKGSRYDRFEGEIKGDRLTLKINGQLVFENRKVDVPAKGPIVLTSLGPMTFTNIYVRPLRD